MKFGKVESVDGIDLSLPKDAERTKQILEQNQLANGQPKVYIGCPRWAKSELKGFYPKGTKDELTYYSSQFNAIEMNAFYYRIFKPDVVDRWYDRSAPDFKFFPKVPQLISQFRRLKNCRNELDDFLTSISHFREKLGTCFLQMNENFGPDKFSDLEAFLKSWPVDVPLAVELRHHNWHQGQMASELYAMLEEYGKGNVITDTAGRRDLLHMHLTTPYSFIRFTGANHASDIDRLDAWFERLTEWKSLGINNIYIFIHQTIEIDLQMLSARLVERINKEWNYTMVVPGGTNQASLF